MAAAENKQLLQRVFAELEAGEPGPFIAVLADDVRWTIAGSTEWSRTYDGKNAVLSELLGLLPVQAQEHRHDNGP